MISALFYFYHLLTFAMYRVAKAETQYLSILITTMDVILLPAYVAIYVDRHFICISKPFLPRLNANCTK